MAYYHWAADPVTLCARSYPQTGHPKPNGFWFDVNGSWKRWCESTRFLPEKLRYRHSVTILDPGRVLALGSAREIDAFTQRYGHDLSGHIRLGQSVEDVDAFSYRYGSDLFGAVQRQFSHYILWEEVVEKHSGILIRPYSRAGSLTYLWYYGWNCAGGCIWDTSVIRVGPPQKIDS